jgi:hypothetical protein
MDTVFFFESDCFRGYRIYDQSFVSTAIPGRIFILFQVKRIIDAKSEDIVFSSAETTVRMLTKR